MTIVTKNYYKKLFLLSGYIERAPIKNICTAYRILFLDNAAVAALSEGIDLLF